MKKIIVLLMLCVIASCQTSEEKKSSLASPSSFYPKEKAKVLVVGTFHFEYPNLDEIKTAKEDQVDVLKEPKLSELEELITYIEKYKPTKIAIEAFPSFKATERLKKYKKGEYRDRRDERFSLGMRIATDLQLDTLYAVDASNLISDLQKHDSAYVKNMYKYYDVVKEDTYYSYFKNWMKEDTKLEKNTNLLKYFKYANSSEYHKYGYGIYLTGDFKAENYGASDVLASWWYSRNLRMFANIKDIDYTKEDRILVIVGNGHAAVLRQLFECSPEFEFVEFNKL